MSTTIPNPPTEPLQITDLEATNHPQPLTPTEWEAWRVGHHAGRECGLRDGHQTGYREGYAAGYHAAPQIERLKAMRDGHNTAWELAHQLIEGQQHAHRQEIERLKRQLRHEETQ